MYYQLKEPQKGNYKDNDELVGKNLWVHTNRTNMLAKRNGMVGIYIANSNGKKTGSPLYYSNEIYLTGNIVFQTSESGANRIVKTGKRTLIAGASGTVTELSKYTGNGVEISYNPKVGYFFPINDNTKEIIRADTFYINASEQGKYLVIASGLKFKS